MKIKIPNSDTLGMKFIKLSIPTLTEKKLYGCKGLVESYPDSPQKTELLECIKKEFNKRNLDYLDLSNNENNDKPL